MILYKYGIMAMRRIHGRVSCISSSYRCVSTSLLFFSFYFFNQCTILQ